MAIEDYKAKIKSIEKISEDVRIFTLGLDKEINFKSGQFVILILEIRGQRIIAPYSIASNPSEKKTIQFAIKLVDKGRVTSNLLQIL